MAFLADYMARVRDAAADSDWADEPWRLALKEYEIITANRDPARLLQHAQAAKHELSQHGICILRDVSLMFANQAEGIGGRAVRLQVVLGGVDGVSLEVARV